MDKKLTDSEIVKALELWRKELIADYQRLQLLDAPMDCFEEGHADTITKLSNTLDLINRLQAENKKFKDRQKPTGASGYKIENGKVVFFTNMLGGCKIVKENLEEVVKTLNELLQECYSKDEIAFALKCKTEELKTAKAEAYKELLNLLESRLASKTKMTAFGYEIAIIEIRNLLKELVGDTDV